VGRICGGVEVGNLRKGLVSEKMRVKRYGMGRGILSGKKVEVAV